MYIVPGKIRDSAFTLVSLITNECHDVDEKGGGWRQKWWSQRRWLRRMNVINVDKQQTWKTKIKLLDNRCRKAEMSKTL